MTMRLRVNGLEQEVFYDHHALDNLVIPLIEDWMHRTTPGRHFAFLVAPPGAGKSTLALLLHKHFGGQLQCLGIDGFHYPQRALAAMTTKDASGGEVALSSIKGAPETFDVAALEWHLSAALHSTVRWPLYDRTIHDVVPDGPEVTSQHVLLEGTWLLLNEAPWASLRRFADLTIFIKAAPDLLRERLQARKVAGGLPLDEAAAFFARSDGPNVERVLSQSRLDSIDLMLELSADNTFHQIPRKEGTN